MIQNPKIKSSLAALALIIIPAIYMIIGLNFHRACYSGDPEYAYLLNGINIANLKPVGHTDNPGTTVQMYSTLVLRASHFMDFSQKSDLQTDVLSDPDRFVEMERRVSVVINGLMILVVGMVSLLFLKNCWLSLLLQVTPFLSSNLLEHAWTKVSPEPVLIFTVGIFSLVLIAYYLSTNRQNRWYPWIFALISGFGLATKATFLPLIFIPFILLDGWRRRWIYAAAIIPAFILFTIPAIPQYPHMAKWFLGLSTHTGTYGQGSVGIINPVKYVIDFISILRHNTALSVSLFMVSAFLFGIFLQGGFRDAIKKNIELKFVIAILSAQVLGVLMVAKHYHADHYLIPEVCLIGTAFVFILLYVKKNFSAEKLRMLPNVPVILFAFLLGGSLLNVPYLRAANQGYVSASEEYRSVMQQIDKAYPGYVKAYYYPVSINPYSALRWGSVYSRQYNLPVLRTLYPETVFYDARTHVFQVWETEIPVEDLVSEFGGNILLIGGPMTPEEKQNVMAGGLALKPVYSGRTQVFYEIDTANSALFKGLITSAPLWTAECNADTLSPDKQFFVENGEKWSNTGVWSGEITRSGSGSVKLTKDNIYAMEYLIDSVRPGQRYKFSAWRKGAHSQSFLVATSPEKGGFYKQSDNYFHVDDKGWEQLILNITIPDDFKGTALKLYIWNNSGSTVYFDDFAVTRKN